MGDLGQRAQELAARSGLPVLALQRLTADDIKSRNHFLGLPKAIDPTEYTRIVAAESIAIESARQQRGAGSLALVGASAGAERGLAHMETDSGLYRSLFVFDPTAMRSSLAPAAFVQWAAYQVRVQYADKTGQADTPNSNKLPYPTTGEIGPLEDMFVHRKIWTRGESFRSLMRLAALESPGAKNVLTRAYFPSRTFLGSTEVQHEVASRLMDAALSTGANFTAQTVELPHRATDDPVRLARMVLASGVLEAPKSQQS